MGADKHVTIAAETTVHVPIEQAWEYWTAPEQMKWYFASDDWHAPHAENDLRAGGKFVTRMEAKDGSFGFDFGGVYDEVRTNEWIAFTLGDGRKTNVTFASQDNGTRVTESFDAEATNELELQRAGWHAILDNYKKYVEQSK